MRDRTAPSVFAGLDRIFRILGGAPTYLLTDNEKTVTTGHIAGVPVRNRPAVTFGRYYGISVLTCQPADPASKGGVENAVKLAKADIVPTETNLLPQYATFAERRSSMLGVRHRDQCPRAPHHGSPPRRDAQPGTPRTARGARPAAHRRTGRDPPGPRQHPDGHLRTLPILRYQQHYWAKPCGSVITTAPTKSSSAPSTTAARSKWRGTAAPPRAAPPSTTVISPSHRDKVPGDYRIRARTVSEQTFLALGPGAAVWLKEAAAVGTERILQKMAHAVELSALGGRADVDWALGHAAVHGRFATGDLDSILAAKGLDPTRRGAGEDTSLAQGTSGWNLFGATIIDAPEAGIA